MPEVSVLRERGWTGVQVHRDAGTDIVALRGRGARQAGLAGMETDAKFVVLAASQECVVDDGTFLRVNGKTIPIVAAEGTIAVDGSDIATGRE